jgi:hypothetical protein
MAHLEVHIFIAAAPEAVWDVLADLERQGDWMVDLRELTITSEQRRGSGTVMRVTSDLFGRPMVKDVMEVTVWEPPRRMDVMHRGQFSGSGSFVITAADNGAIFTWSEDLRPPLGVLGEAMFALVIGPHLRRVFNRSLANVKRLAEAGPRGDGQQE